MKKEMGILTILIVLVVVLVGAQIFLPQPTVASDKLKKFSSCQEIKNFVKSSTESYNSYGLGAGIFSTAMKSMAVPTMSQATAGAAETTGTPAEDFSQTNVQVQGVDEADIVKNDGKYIYTVSGNNVVIVDAYPAESSKIISEINLTGTPLEIFINKDKLIVFGQITRSYEPTSETKTVGIATPSYYPYYSEGTFINVFDVSDRSNPVMTRSLTLNGTYFDSRMIGDYVYVIMNQDYYGGVEPVPIPYVTSEGQTKQVCGCSDVYYFDSPDYSYRFTTFASINTQNDNEEMTSKVFLMGSAQNMYVSLNNIYVTYIKQMDNNYYTQKLINDVYIPSVPALISARINDIMNSLNNSYDRMQKIGEVIQNYSQGLNDQERTNFDQVIQERTQKFENDIAKETEKTVIHKISVSNGNIDYKSQGEVPGHILNQFSMDEYNNYFRIATTISGYVDNKDTSTNNMYVLDENLNTVGSLEGVATGESIYSVRFIGDRAYMVTFRHIDPLFVIDLSNPTSPVVLGQLKIPGYTDYLHPYDETHLIGIGKEVDPSIDADKVHTEGAVYYTAIQGVKISIFDVSDVSNPVEMYKEVIGDRGTESLATSDHKAFLFDKDKELLVIPLTVAQLKPGQTKDMQGDFVFQGAYVYKINLQEGLVLKGKVTHLQNNSDLINSGYYYYGSPFDVKRSLYMNNVLYTLSDEMIKMNNLDDMSEINSIQLPYVAAQGYYPYVR